jgi:U2 small nuclear ribonucleoprotein A'
VSDSPHPSRDRPTNTHLQGQDAIDFTDNAITHLANFPLSPRLRTLLLAQNRIAAIAPALAASLPRLTTLVLTSNRIAHLADLEPLRGLAQLTHLVLADNPVARRQHYRAWVVWRCPSVRFLDFDKVSDGERKKARELFGDGDAGMTELAREILRVKSAAAAAADAGGDVDMGDARDTNGAVGGRVKLKPEERKRVEALIRNATSLAEIERLESELSRGRVPPGVLDA